MKALESLTWEEKEDLLEVVIAQVKLFCNEVRPAAQIDRYSKELMFNQFLDKQLAVLDYLGLDEECQEAISAECWRRYTSPSW